ncbi:MAG: Aspartate ammonia-lyase [Elusimicrobia bacterium]|nr:Aspartate ammonia-lyase [Elusimicrobiota bacterium]
MYLYWSTESSFSYHRKKELTQLSMTTTRTEKDSIGIKEIPADAYYGINALRGKENFPISGLTAHPRFIDAFMYIKKAAAQANKELGLIKPEQADSISQACEEVLAGKFRDQFIVDVFQMGAGTALHMNVNEVLANRAVEILGGKKGDYSRVNPNDHVNFGQSTNDVFPTAIRVATRLFLNELIPVVDNLGDVFLDKGKEFDDVIKSARTHLQDAVPIRLGQEFSAYGLAIKRCAKRILQSASEIEELGIGGSAAGTGLNTHPSYAKRVVDLLSKDTKATFRPAEDKREAMQSQRSVAEVSSAIKNLALEMTRISNDLRLLSSGPTTGFAEIFLPGLAAGSSIMPGKVNPSMPEMMNMVCYQVIGNDMAISLAVQAGQLELNVMMPLMAYDMMFTIEIFKNALQVFTDLCAKGISADKDKCRRYAEMSMSLATALNPIIGYAKAAEIVKEAMKTGKTIVETIKEKNILSPEKLEEVLNLKSLTEPGVPK